MYAYAITVSAAARSKWLPKPEQKYHLNTAQVLYSRSLRCPSAEIHFFLVPLAALLDTSKLNTIGEGPVDLWYRSDVAINRTIGVLRSGNWPGFIISADQVLHIFVTSQCARTVFGRLGNLKWSCSNRTIGVSFVYDVLNDDLQYEKWYSSVLLTGLNHLQLSNGHSVVEWVERAKDFLGEQKKKATIPYLRKQMLDEQQVDQVENFHLPLRDQMLLLEGANTTSSMIIDALGTTTAAREVTAY
uniref:Uncharacterized protein n=1 Tax=Solanum lycopersicum TaxID=4081 RepID=A0A3Q7FNW3_SOLLC